MLYDAVAVLCSQEGAQQLAGHPAAKDFVTDAHAHCKVIGYTPPARDLFDAAGLGAPADNGYVDVSGRAWRLSVPRGVPRRATLGACRFRMTTLRMTTLSDLRTFSAETSSRIS